MQWETILSLGDSITIGSRTYLGYPERFGSLLQAETATEWNVINFAESGITAIELHRKLARDMNHLCALAPDFLSIMIGTNDAKKETNERDFALAYRQVLVKSKILAPNSLIVTLPIPSLQCGVKLPYAFEMNARIKGYNDIITQIANELGTLLLPLDLNAFHFCDGVHLNSEGVNHVAEQLAKFVLDRRGIERDLKKAEQNHGSEEIRAEALVKKLV